MGTPSTPLQPARRLLRGRNLHALAWWLPLAAIFTALVAGMLGYTPFEPAIAAAPSPDTSTVVVGGAVDKEVHLSSACALASLTIGTLVPGDPAREASADCDVTFGSNNSVLGAELTVVDSSAGTSPGRDAMVCIASSCGFPGSPRSLPDTQGNPLPAGSAFAVRLANFSGAASGVWTVNGSAAPTGQFYDVQDTPDIACQTASAADGICSFRFAASASGTQDPGTYQALVDFAVQAR